ncbi:hypothetical protein ABFS82_14G104900 [Erythranthe guttata]|uniref:uncharacterized protein LOC105955043 n=1 Tax=Erythranthe guttata TaxID=4155 RepID=UPI00064D784D|nr:PREDICTED: uncharacterized protein LOC105955043 [Erythranthe guttata]|eukprot:XP_012834196.1 PREDICTED: uncharacterized protein LOC105955043 [Erythranthe guttata]
MARIGIKNTKIMLTKPFSVHGLGIGLRNRTSKAARENQRRNGEEVTAAAGGGERAEKTAERWWMPHPRTGIYFPPGQEWVMDGIPNGAASFDCTFWLRSIDGVDHHRD